MADECVLFQKRLNKLIEILHLLKNQFPKIEISSWLSKLHKLLSLVENTDSLNTGGNFEWVDSKIVSSLRTGELISLEHVNFCSSAVLDRLNPVFEPNGNLLISEKGVLNSEECEIIEKHPNFQAFLTIDAKNGELSRAMRNRCIEIALNINNYTTDDLRLIVYSNGVKDIHAINALLSIYNEINALDEVINFSLSYLSKFSFLVSCYMKIGYSIQSSIYQSGIDVYIHPSTVDPLGFGLQYYHESLKEIIKRCSSSVSISNKLSLRNIVLTCENANRIELVVCQTEPLKYLKNSVDLSLLLSSVENLKFENREKMISYYILLLYEISSLKDIHIRQIYIKKIFDENEMVLSLNNKLYNVIDSFKNEVITEHNLPWNTKMFPKIRDYESTDSLKEVEISLTLLCHFLLNEININHGKLGQLSAISYSNAVSTKSISNKLNNSFLQHMFSYLVNLKCVILAAIKSNKWTMDEYFKMSLSFLWFNRMLDCASHKIIIDNKINQTLMDRLIVHFKWMQKHLMIPEFHNLNADMDKSYGQLLCYTEEVDKHSNKFNKLYIKEMLDFNPFYLEEQISFYTICSSLNQLIETVPR